MMCGGKGSFSFSLYLDSAFSALHDPKASQGHSFSSLCILSSSASGGVFGVY